MNVRCRLSEQRANQEQLARERLTEKLRLRRQKLQATTDEPAKSVPQPDDPGDVIAWQEAVTKEMEQKHVEERDFLMTVIRDVLTNSFLVIEVKLLSIDLKYMYIVLQCVMWS